MRPCCSRPHPRARSTRRAWRSARRSSARAGPRPGPDTAAASSNGDGQRARRCERTARRPARIGWPKPSAVSCMRGVCSREAAVPRAARRRRARGRPGARSVYVSSDDPDDDEQHDERTVARPVRALIGASKSQRPSTASRRAASSRSSCGDRVERRMTLTGNSRAARSRARARRAPHARTGRHPRAFASAGSRGLPQEHDAVELHHDIGRQALRRGPARPRRPAPAC